VLAALVVAELLLRVFGSALSGDVEHLRQVDDVVEQVARAPGTSVLFWGNSLIAAGVDLDRLRDTVSARVGGSVAAGMVRPDGTTPLEWHYLFRKIVLSRGLDVDVLVLGFGPGHLIDRPASESLDRLAAHYVGWSDVPELFGSDVTGIEPRSSFVLSRLSATHSLRERIRDRVLDALVPGYRGLARDLLTRPSPGAGGVEPPPGGAGRTYRNLELFLEDATSTGALVIGVPMPAPREWSVEPAEAAAFARVGAPVLDVRGDVELGPERFYDGEHLDEVGRDRFTATLAPRLGDMIAALVR
jgi:hypothetical protein